MVPCWLGTYCPTAGLTQAQICPAGYYCLDVNTKDSCGLGGYCPTGSIVYTQCSPGYYCPNTTVQIACSAGYYSTIGSKSPTLCPAGSFCPNPNTLTPQVCSNIVFCTGMASGGSFNYDVSGYVVHQFLSNGTITFSHQTVADVLVIGGGGAGGVGGGGAGAVVYYPLYSFAAQKYDIVVGLGGLGGFGVTPCGEVSMSGQASSISLGSAIQFLAVGGGAGGNINCDHTSGLTGSAGGSSGGGGYFNIATGSPSLSPIPAETNWVASVSGQSPTTAPNYVFGSKGGQGDDSTDYDTAGGGGGGAGGSGQDAYVCYFGSDGKNYFFPGNGGNGLSLQVLSTFGISFTNLATLFNTQYYIAGGGGGNSQGYCRGYTGNNDGGIAGVGGGGLNIGSGGNKLADGGSGLVLVRYAAQCSPPLVTYCPPGSTSNTPCQPGYYCSTARTQLLCGLGNYCPEGSPSQIPCKTTSYCPDGSWQDICPTGMFIDANNGMCTSCPAGSNTAMPDMTLCS